MHYCDLAERKPSWDGIIVVKWTRSRGWEEGVGDGWVGRKGSENFIFPAADGVAFLWSARWHLFIWPRHPTVTLSHWLSPGTRMLAAIFLLFQPSVHHTFTHRGHKILLNSKKLTMTEKQTQFMASSSSFFFFFLGIWDYFMFQDLLPIYSWWKNWDEWRISTSINLQCRLSVGCK